MVQKAELLGKNRPERSGMLGIEWIYQYCKEKHENVDLSREDRDLFCANRNIGDFTYQFMEGFSKT